MKTACCAALLFCLMALRPSPACAQNPVVSPRDEPAAGARITGTLKAEQTGAPVAGVPIGFQNEDSPSMIYRTGFPRYYSATTDAEGRFEVRDIVPGDYVARTGYVRDTELGGVVIPIAPIRVEEGKSVENVSLTWAKGAVITGRALNAETNAPVGRCDFVACIPGARRSYASTATDETGAFRIRLPPGEYRFMFYHERFREDRNPAAVTVTGDVELPPTLLQPWPTLTLAVVDEAGAPVPRAAVWANKIPPDLTDERGCAEIVVRSTRGNLGPFRVVSESKELACFPATAPPGAKEMTIVLHKSVSVAGIVQNADGAPIRGARVRACWVVAKARQSDDDRNAVATGRDGRFRITGLPPGLEYSAEVVEAPGYAPNAPWAAPRVAAGPGETAELAPIILKAADSVIAGGITDSSGAPVAQAVITLGRKAAISDDKGHFELRNVALERVKLLVTPPMQEGVMPRSVARDVGPEEFANVKIVLGDEAHPAEGIRAPAQTTPDAATPPAPGRK